MLSFQNRSAATRDAGGAKAPAFLRVLGFVVQLVRCRPADAFGLVLATGCSLAVLVNTLFLQSGPPPAPIFVERSRPVSSGEPTGSFVAAAPRPRPAELGARLDPPPPRARGEIISDIQHELDRRGYYDGPIDGVDGPRTENAIRDFTQAAGLKWNGDVSDDLLHAMARSPIRAAGRTPASAGAARTDAIGDLIAMSSRRILAVQRALADFGYGPVKPTGVFNADTKAAIEKFERDRKLSVTGQISDRLMRELATVTGRALE